MVVNGALLSSVSVQSLFRGAALEIGDHAGFLQRRARLRRVRPPIGRREDPEE